MLDKDELKHYGVLGMKWGKRKDEDSSDDGEGSGAGGIGEEIENQLESLKDEYDQYKFEKKVKKIKKEIQSTLNGIKESVKDNGYELLAKIFGESKPKKTITVYMEKPPE